MMVGLAAGFESLGVLGVLVLAISLQSSYYETDPRATHIPLSVGWRPIFN